MDAAVDPPAPPQAHYGTGSTEALGEDASASALRGLETLQRAHSRAVELERLKREIARDMELLVAAEDVLADCRAEREALADERRVRLEELQTISADIEALDGAIAASTAERDTIHERQRSLERMYEDVKDSADAERARLGLPKLPHFRDERDALQALYLERRRSRWREAADGSPSSVASSAGQAGPPTVAQIADGVRLVVRPPGRKRGRPPKRGG